MVIRVFEGDPSCSDEHWKSKEYTRFGEVSDGYHTFAELYEYRLLYNAGFFNELCILGNPYRIHKSKKHRGELEDCFGGGWFIVMATLPQGQVSNHYKLEHWDLFDIPEQYQADQYDGHTPAVAAQRLKEFLTNG